MKKGINTLELLFISMLLLKLLKAGPFEFYSWKLVFTPFIIDILCYFFKKVYNKLGLDLVIKDAIHYQRLNMKYKQEVKEYKKTIERSTRNEK